MKPFAYAFLNYLHVVGAIFAIGPYAVFFFLMRRLKKAETGHIPEHFSVLRFVVWVSKHAGHVLVITGVLLWWLGGFPLFTSWILIPVVILFSGLFFLARAFSPVIEALEKGEINRDAGMKKLRTSLYGYLIILLVSMWFMIAKPVLW